MNEKPEEHKDGRFKETVSSEWAKIRADPEQYKAYMDRKRRYRERVKNGEVQPRKRGIMFMTAAATKKTPTRTAVVSEIIDKLYKLEWTPDELRTVWDMIKDLNRLGVGSKK